MDREKERIRYRDLQNNENIQCDYPHIGQRANRKMFLKMVCGRSYSNGNTFKTKTKTKIYRTNILK